MRMCLLIHCESALPGNYAPQIVFAPVRPAGLFLAPANKPVWENDILMITV
jgi:hypothetical protein